MEHKIVNISEKKIFVSAVFKDLNQKLFIKFSYNYTNFTEDMDFLDLKDSVVFDLVIQNEENEEVTLNKELTAKLFENLYSIISQELKKENEFISSHCTGKIPSSSYSNSIRERSISNYPKLIRTLTLNSGEVLEFRQSGEELKYVLKDSEDNIVRDSNGFAMYLNKDQMISKGLNLYDTSIIVFNSEKKSIALASDEWGADGIWVNLDYQRQGIGTELLSEFRKQFKDSRKIGQMTDAGVELTRSYYRKRLTET